MLKFFLKFNQIIFIIQYRDVSYVQYRDVLIPKSPPNPRETSERINFNVINKN